MVRSMDSRADMPLEASLSATTDVEVVRRIRSWMKSQLEARRYPEGFTADVLVAVSEGLSNIVRHGYQGQGGRPISIRLAMAPDGITAEMTDDAPPFRPAKVTAPSPEDLAEGGYGLHLIHSLMDEIRYEPSQGRGNRLRLTKRVRRTLSGAAA
jgi:anti-sigma regulatory factor (Ser/Thr protein kinase)